MKIHIEGSRGARPPSRRTLYCDGSADPPFREGLDIELSHWIPNRTPAKYKADSSTEIALNFVADAQRGSGFDLVVNNHVDVDGLLALYGVVQGEAALPHRHTLVQAAEMGDFWAWGDAPAQALFDGLLAAFEEDRKMITAQARNLALKPGLPMLPLHMDAALLQFRRLVTLAIEAESK